MNAIAGENCMNARNRASVARWPLCALARSCTTAASVSAVMLMTFMKPATSTASPRFRALANGPSPAALPASANVPRRAVTAVTPG